MIEDIATAVTVRMDHRAEATEMRLYVVSYY
jgi:hypothetical protein